MKLKYKILWIDDTPEWVELKIDEVRSYLSEFGFDLEYDIKTSYKDIDFTQYDILAIDYSLSGDENGVEAMKLVRAEDVYTEILFYSQDGEGALREEMKKNSIDGVYCAYRQDSIDRLKKLIDTTIRKTQEINNLRGLVMAEVSEIDKLIKLILLKLSWTEEHFLDRHKKIEKFHDDEKKKLAKYLPFESSKVSPFVHGHFISRLSFWSLEKFLSSEEWENIKQHENLLDKRNVLAHGIEASNTHKEMILNMIGRDGAEKPHKFTPEEFTELRKEIKKFKEYLTTMLQTLE